MSAAAFPLASLRMIIQTFFVGDMDRNIPTACDYVVAFIDLLGQKEAMKERSLPDDEQKAIETIRQSVGKIIGTQEHFQTFLDAFTSERTLYSQLPRHMQNDLPDMASGELRWQRFSDGFVIYAPLGTGLLRSPANSIFAILMAAGTHCLLGLAGRSPLRIGIDVAWGVEPNPNEIYGAAVAYAHHLESSVAQWPRVVVGEGLIDYLHYYVDSASEDLSQQVRKLISERCLSFITSDTDGVQIVDYLGPDYRRVAGNAISLEVLTKANEFVSEQLIYWQYRDDQKLLGRYGEVKKYFNSRGAI